MKPEDTNTAGMPPVEPTVRPVAWADDKVMAGGIGNCASDAAKTYWQRSNQFDRMSAALLAHPLFDGQTLWNACARAGDVERDKLRARLMEMHERDKHRHNYWACAVVELFGPNARVSGPNRPRPNDRSEQKHAAC